MEITGGKQRLIFGLAGMAILLLIVFPEPSEMANFWIGCSQGNFQPSNTCSRICRMLGNLTSCCYGVNYAGRTACACCNGTTNCPQNCNTNCVMVSITTENCQATNVEATLIENKEGGEGGVEGGPSMFDQFFFGPDLIPVIPGTRQESLRLASSIPEDKS